MSDDLIVRMEGITKRFSMVRALNHVDFELKRGETHALLGENGSGKSSLIKVLGGIFKKDAGNIYIDGELKNINSVKDAHDLGISIVHQELSFAPDMTVTENIFMGREEKNKFGFVDRKKMRESAKESLIRFGSTIDPDSKMRTLSISEQQVIEIIKALDNNARIIVMDEPSASLSLREVEALYETVDRLKIMNISIIYISHRIEELYRLAERVTVLRDGVLIGTENLDEISENELVNMMAGREIQAYEGKHKYSKNDVILEVNNLSRGKRVIDMNFKVHRGEIVGLSGIVGAGRSECAQIIAGIDKGYNGQIVFEGKEIIIKNAKDAISRGIVLAPEDRKKEGLILNQTIKFNISLNVLEKIIKFIGVNRKKEEEIAEDAIDTLGIKTLSKEAFVRALSGGNQQKVVLGKWLATDPKLLILDKPTRGIDVGAKAEIYDLLDYLSAKGMSTLVISSDLPEMVRICDTIFVVREGKTVANFDRKDFDQEEIIKYATGVIQQ